VTDLPRLNRGHLEILTKFHEEGGTGQLDIHGRVTVGPTRHLMAGDPKAWMTLVARGYIGEERDLILITQEGRAEAERVIAGRTREAML